MANLVSTMGYYARDVNQIKNLAAAGFFTLWTRLPTLIRQSAGSDAEPILPVCDHVCRVAKYELSELKSSKRAL
ncbi:hypothetical protein FND52_17985 [Atlantibacter subterranea]|nr:hypothetical protein FND52_17985 [Atlantibacter subterranea]